MRNKNIRKALALTKNAMAYTLEIHEQLRDINTIDIPEKEQIYAILENTEFNPQMMYSSNIRLHLREYVTLIRYYEQLPAVKDIQDEDEIARKQALDKVMKIFKKRVEAFCLSNKIKFFGSSDESYGTFEIDWESFRSRFSLVTATDLSCILR